MHACRWAIRTRRHLGAKDADHARLGGPCQALAVRRSTRQSGTLQLGDDDLRWQAFQCLHFLDFGDGGTLLPALHPGAEDGE